MKKFKQIFFCVIIFGFVSFFCYVIIDEFYQLNLIEKLKEDPSLIFLLHLTFFSILSFLFNILKLDNHINLNSLSYKVLRIGDLVFSLSMTILISIGIYYIILDYHNINRTADFVGLKISAIVFIFIICIFILIDNVKFHRGQKALSNNDSSIDNIGE